MSTDARDGYAKARAPADTELGEWQTFKATVK
jgi:hypothetical protein